MNLKKCQIVSVEGIEARVNENGLVCLNDLYEGHEDKLRSLWKWMNTKRIQKIVASLARKLGVRHSRIVKTYTGRTGSTWAHMDIAVECAKHLTGSNRDIATFQGMDIKLEDEMMNLTDMWKASGKNDDYKPARWVRQADASKFIESVAKNEKVLVEHLFRITRGRHGGTWAHWQIALAYAKYLSTELHMFVNEVFRGYMTADKHMASDMTGRMVDQDKADVAVVATEQITDVGQAGRVYKGAGFSAQSIQRIVH